MWKQHPHGWYVEPEWVTRALLGVEAFDGETWDPAAGSGAIVRTFRDAGLHAYGTDLLARAPEAEWFARTGDFLGEAPPWFSPDSIVTNPPYFGGHGAEAFTRRALAIARCKVAIFVNDRFLDSDRRAAGLFAEHPPSRVWIVTPRPSCPPGEYLAAGNKAEGGLANYCWIVWDKAHVGPAQLGWARRPR